MDRVFSIREWWADAQRVGERKAARAGEDARRRAVVHVNRLQALTDDELIVSAPAKTSLSTPDHEMEMRRRLKDAILAQIAESRRGGSGERGVRR
jgi:hypothetical protein